MDQALIGRSLSGRCAIAAAVAFLAWPAAAGAQSNGSRADDQPRFEIAAGVFAARADVVAASGAPGNPGTSIDFTNELGITGGWFPDVSATVRLKSRHVLRFEYLRVADDSTGTLTRNVMFSGVVFPAGARVDAGFDLHAWRAGYEYEFARWSGGAAGAIVDFRGNEVAIRLAGAGEAASRSTSLPLPAVGVAVRQRIHGRIFAAAELTGFAVPTNASRTYGGHFVDGDAYVELPAFRTLFVRGGFRIIDSTHLGDSDSGTLRLAGALLTAVVRF